MLFKEVKYAGKEFKMEKETLPRPIYLSFSNAIHADGKMRVNLDNLPKLKPKAYPSRR